MTRNTRASRCLSAAAALAMPAAAVFAQCDVYRLGLPDFDQRRDVLPNGGNAYCVPTSGMNILGYIANHGFPDVLDGPRSWQSQANYPLVTSALAVMGSPLFMSTDEDTGTNWGSFRSGMQEWLDNAYPDMFTVSVAGPSGQWVPTPNVLAFLEASQCLVAIAHGRYTFDTCGANPSQWRRTGGHCVTLARVYDACSASPEVWYRDPAGHGGENTSQAQFVTQKSDYTFFASSFNGSDTCIADPVARSMWRRLDPDASVMSILDGYGYVMCAEALSGSAELGQVSVVGTYDMDTLSAPPRHTHSLPTGQVLLDLQYDCVTPTPIVLTRTGPAYTLARLDRNTGERTTIAVFSQPVSKLVIGRRNDAYLWHQLTPTAGRMIRIDLATGGVLNSLALPGEPRAAEIDPLTDGLLLIRAAGTGIARCGPFLDHYMEEDFPPSLAPMPPSVSVAPLTGVPGGAVVAAGDLDTIYVFDGSEHGVLRLRDTITGVPHPANVSVTHAGTLVCTSDGSVRALRRDAGGVWRTTNFPMSGERVGAFFRLHQGRENAGDWFGTRADVNIIPTDRGEIAEDCPADFNADRRVTSQDFFDYLAAFFRNLPAADIDADGRVGSPDFFAFLTSFFAGC